MTGQNDFAVTFWGVRGSIPTGSAETIRYGGDTPCLEIVCGDTTMIFDAGSGIRRLGAKLLEESDGKTLDLDIFLTHTHFDHVCGIPFFAPFYIPGNKFNLYSGHLSDGRTSYDALVEMMAAPLLPITPEIFQAYMEHHRIEVNDVLEPRKGNGVKVFTGKLNHPQGAVGYRIEYQDKSICYVTDTEHFEDGLDQNIIDLIQDTDIFIYDATYCDAEYPKYKTYGHSTWEEGVRLANAANAKTYVIFHHEPAHGDEHMDKVAIEAEKMRPGTIVAKQNMTLRP